MKIKTLIIGILIGIMFIMSCGFVSLNSNIIKEGIEKGDLILLSSQWMNSHVYSILEDSVRNNICYSVTNGYSSSIYCLPEK